MAKKKESNPEPEKKYSGKVHPWKNFPPDCKLAQELARKLSEFEDASIKVRQALAKKYNVEYHNPYFTKVIPDALIKK